MNEQENRGEWLKFAILALVLLGTVLVIGLLRPFIFNTVIPAIMGEGMVLPPQEPVPALPTITPPVITPPSDVAEPYPVTTPAEPGQIFIPVQTDSETAENPAYPAAATVAPPNAITHIVQPGESLTTIAQKYNVTIQSIIEANKLTNPNRLLAGTTLIIIASEP